MDRRDVIVIGAMAAAALAGHPAGRCASRSIGQHDEGISVGCHMDKATMERFARTLTLDCADCWHG